MTFLKRNLIALFVLLSASYSYAQKTDQRSASEIKLALEKLNFLGSVLYVAAHPDDENTRLLAYLSKERKANTAYLSMTRGDGGQNLIGPEIREYLGIIRTQELLAARKRDGGQQMFTRANDFGYSKSPDETQDIWERDEVLSDVVWAFRKFQPDVIICRFPVDGGGGHGHHTTSAILAHEAFDIANDPNRFEDQLQFVDTWQPKRLFLNTGRWWNPDISDSDPGVIMVDVGKYNPLLGKSYTEIAADSRSQHKSQGFGATGSRGAQAEYLEFRKGESVENDLFEGIDTSWERVSGGKAIEKQINAVIKKYNPSAPHQIVPDLFGIHAKISKIDNPYWKRVKLKEVESLIIDCLGLYLEVRADDYLYTPGAELEIDVEATNRSPIEVTLKSLSLSTGKDSSIAHILTPNIEHLFTVPLTIPEDIEYTQPYWLRSKGSLGMYKVDNRLEIGDPQNEPAIKTYLHLEIMDKSLVIERPIIYRWNDPVKGEQYRPLAISPPVFIQVPEPLLVFTSDAPRVVDITVKSAINQLSGTLIVDLPSGWTAEPSRLDLNIVGKLNEKSVKVKITPPKGQSQGSVKFGFETKGKVYRRQLISVAYDHIPTQLVFPPSSAELSKVNIKKKGDLIGYIQGAGDEIPSSLRNVGYEVWEMSDDDITSENLQRLDALVLGVRALNTRERLSFAMDEILKFAKSGGTVVIQYNTNRSLVTDNFSPYSLELSRDRVTKEEAPVTILAKSHPVIEGPNPITASDFDGWVQERGLYFPDKWGSEFVPILASADPNESQKEGGLLIAEYGEGHFVYTGYSFFRQLPAGVPGALKLFVNLVSLGQGDTVEP